MKVQCPHCKKVLSVPDEYEGKRIKCKGCQGVLITNPLEEKIIIPKSPKPKPTPIVVPIDVLQASESPKSTAPQESQLLPSRGNFLTKLWNRSPVAFRTGFLTTIGVLSALALCIYIYGRISSSHPPLKPEPIYPTIISPMPEKVRAQKSIEVLYYQIVNAFSNSSFDFFLVSKIMLDNGQKKYLGETSDGLASLEIIGKNNISQATLLIWLPNDQPDILERNIRIQFRFLEIMVPEWPSSPKWLSTIVEESDYSSDDLGGEIIKGNKLITIKFCRPLGFAILTIKHKSQAEF